MKKTFSLLVVGILCGVVVSAQSPPPKDLSNSTPNVVPPSPNAAAMEKFGQIPVGYSTGIPSISYPVWSWQRGNFSYSVDLSYHAGGHRVSDMASNVGLGWSVSGMGRISRTVRGRSDDLPVYGFMHTPPMLNAHTIQYDGSYQVVKNIIPDYIDPNVMITKINSTASGIVGQIAKGQLDGEQDLFSINVNGISCRFVIDKNRTITPLEKTNLKITMQLGTDNKIFSFTVIDDKGLVYTFDKIENQHSESFSDPVTIYTKIESYTSGWLISKISDPNTNDHILFNYSTGPVKIYENGYSQTQSMDYGMYVVADNSLNLVWAPASNSFSYSLIRTTEPILQNITFPDGSNLIFEYAINREDYINDKALTMISVRNLHNSLVKKFKLNYSYFTSPNEQMSGLYFPSGNNYNKRLRLDKIDEYANNDVSFKSTIYTYNATVLNRRDSRNIDYWGYNVNPIRNNLEYVPSVRLELQELYYNTHNTHLPGADRRPDAVYAKAGVLERIQYPTGGTTSFEYESNKAFSSVNYYEDKLVSNTPEWIQSSFGVNYSLNFPLRNNTNVDFLFKTEEFNPRPIPNPNIPQPCFSDMQDLKMARYEITSTDGSFSAFVEKPYAHFLGGYRQIINLPLNKSYLIKFIYNTALNCSFIYPFKALATGTYYQPVTDKLAGGLRIKKIISNDGATNTFLKEFSYNKDDATSSASLNIIPNFSYYRTTADAQCFSCQPMSPPYMTIRQIVRSCSPIYSLDFHSGSPVVYTKVIEKEADGSSTERYYDPIYNDFNTSVYPYLPIEQYPQLSGMLTKEILKSNTGEIKREKTFQYIKDLAILPGTGNINIKAGKIASAYSYSAEGYATQSYKHKVAYAEESSSTTKNFENGNVLTQTDYKTYDPVKKYLRIHTSTNSKNETVSQQYSYSFDKTGTVYSAMLAKNMLNYPAGSTQQKSNVTVSQHQTNYYLYVNNMLPKASGVQSALLGAGLETDISFDAYDDKGNLLQYTGKDGIITSFIWGYRKQYPVAKITGKNYTDAVTQSLINMVVVNDPGNENLLRAELDKLYLLNNCLVTTYTYKPLVGVTSEKDANKNMVSYTYDIYNRLSLVRDKDNNIIKKICYNYHGQVMDCGYGIVAGWSTISSTCEVNALGQFTGKTILKEQDRNPSSTTFNAIRTTILTEPNPACVCVGPDKKPVDGICETGVKVCTSNFRENGIWKHNYHYKWSDNSISATYVGANLCAF